MPGRDVPKLSDILGRKPKPLRLLQERIPEL
jgi:hypothetical protein